MGQEVLGQEVGNRHTLFQLNMQHYFKSHDEVQYGAM